MSNGSNSITYACPRCATLADPSARRCANVNCKAELGFCSHCRQVSTFQEGHCTRCEGKVVSCVMRSLGNNCNGYARAEGLGRVFCDRCRERSGVVVRWGLGIVAAGRVASWFRPKT